MASFVSTEHEGRGCDRHDRQSTAERALRRTPRGASGRDRATRRRRRHARDRPCRRRRPRVRGRRRHQGVPGTARGGRCRDRLRPPTAIPRTPNGRSAHAVRRRDQGLLPRRWPRARAVLRRPDLRRRRAVRAAGGEARPRSLAAAAPSGCHVSSVRAGRRSSTLGGDSIDADYRLRLGSRRAGRSA